MRGGGGGGGRGGAAATPDLNGSGVYRSEDGGNGKTWKQMSGCDDRPMYFSQIRVDPNNDQKIFTGGNPGRVSIDGGKTWYGMNASHTDYHAIWINPKDSRQVWVGHDGGFDSSNNGAKPGSWDHHNDMAVGQFYQVSADMRRPYWVCGGLQDNNAWCGPSALRSTGGPTNDDWFTVAGGVRRLLYSPGSQRLGHCIRRIAGRRDVSPPILRNGSTKRASGPMLDAARFRGAAKRKPQARRRLRAVLLRPRRRRMPVASAGSEDAAAHPM